MRKLIEAESGVEDKMEIGIKTLKGEVYSVLVTPTMTTLELKRSVAQLLSADIRGIKLIITGRVMADDRPATYYGVSATSFIVVLMSRTKPT
jgi:hypothetical protein